MRERVERFPQASTGPDDGPPSMFERPEAVDEIPPPPPAPPAPLSKRSKALMQIDEGVWIDPLHIVCVEPYAIGNKGYVRVSMDNGDSFLCRYHHCEPNKPDPQVAEDMMADLNSKMAETYR